MAGQPTLGLQIRKLFFVISVFGLATSRLYGSVDAELVRKLRSLSNIDMEHQVKDEVLTSFAPSEVIPAVREVLDTDNVVTYHEEMRQALYEILSASETPNGQFSYSDSTQIEIFIDGLTDTWTPIRTQCIAALARCDLNTTEVLTVHSVYQGGDSYAPMMLDALMLSSRNADKLDATQRGTLASELLDGLATVSGDAINLIPARVAAAFRFDLAYALNRVQESFSSYPTDIAERAAVGLVACWSENFLVTPVVDAQAWFTEVFCHTATTSQDVGVVGAMLSALLVRIQSPTAGLSESECDNIIDATDSLSAHSDPDIAEIASEVGGHVQSMCQ